MAAPLECSRDRTFVRSDPVKSARSLLYRPGLTPPGGFDCSHRWSPVKCVRIRRGQSGDTHLGQSHRPFLLHRGHVAIHGGLAHLGTVLLNQLLEDPTCGVTLLFRRRLVVGQPAVDDGLPGSEDGARSRGNLALRRHRRSKGLVHRSAVHAERAGELPDRKTFRSQRSPSGLLEQFHLRPLRHGAQASAHPQGTGGPLRRWTPSEARSNGLRLDAVGPGQVITPTGWCGGRLTPRAWT
jgi:hypothetical protein